MRPIADYPKHRELDVLVAAFEAGDHRRVRAGAADLASRTDVPPEVSAAARELRARTEADPLAKALLAITGALLLTLTAYWISIAGGGEQHPPPPPAAPAAATTDAGRAIGP